MSKKSEIEELKKQLADLTKKIARLEEEHREKQREHDPWATSRAIAQLEGVDDLVFSDGGYGPPK